VAGSPVSDIFLMEGGLLCLRFCLITSLRDASREDLALLAFQLWLFMLSAVTVSYRKYCCTGV
jgi:hypothetical protein